MKRVLFVITLLLLVGGIVSLSFNDRHVLTDLRQEGKRIINQIDSFRPPFREYDREGDEGAGYYEKVVEGLFQEISYNGVNTRLYFYVHEENTVQLEYEVPDGSENLEIQTTGNRLSIKEKPGQKVMDNVYEVYIYLPSNYQGKIKVDTVNGQVFAEHLKCPIDITTVNAEVNVYVVEPVNVDIRNVNGFINVTYDEGIKQNLRYDIQITNGVVTVFGETEYGVAGSSHVQGSFGQGNVMLNIESTNSSVNLEAE